MDLHVEQDCLLSPIHQAEQVKKSVENLLNKNLRKNSKGGELLRRFAPGDYAQKLSQMIIRKDTRDLIEFGKQELY